MNFFLKKICLFRKKVVPLHPLLRTIMHYALLIMH